MKPVQNNKLVSRMPTIGFLLVAAAFLAKHIGVSPIAACFLAGFGSAWIGLGILGVFMKKLSPDYVKKQEINQKDERSIQIREKSGYISYLITLFSFAVLEFIFLLTDNNIACVFTIGAMALHIASFFIALCYYNRKI